MSVVQTLGPDSYLGFLERVGEGRDAKTHKALVRFHDSQIPADCYVKAYCSRSAPKGLVNELIGYALTKCGGFDVPNRAAVILLDDGQVNQFTADIEPQRSADGRIVAWCVESLGAPTPMTTYGLPSNGPGFLSFKDDLARWGDLADVAAFDLWVLNDDRNPGNLVRLGRGRYALIDHGHVCSGNSWIAPLDRTDMRPLNKLAWFAWNAKELDGAPQKQHAQIVSSFDRHCIALNKAAEDLDYWLSLLVNPQERDDAEAFLQERLATVREHLRTTFGMLPL